MNYKIIVNLKEFDNFINWLPKLEEGECYYVSLFARKKYHESAKNDKSNIKRFIATSKEWLKIKIAQLEVPLGAYTNKDGSPVAQEALAAYICINPRSLAKAQKLTLVKLAETIADGVYHTNPAQVALTSIHKAKSRTAYVDFDFDFIDFVETDFTNILNRDAYSIIHTRGGFHLLVDPKRVQVQFKNTWYQSLLAMPGCDVSGDTLIPIPGCTQGGFTPKLEK